MTTGLLILAIFLARGRPDVLQGAAGDARAAADGGRDCRHRGGHRPAGVRGPDARRCWPTARRGWPTRWSSRCSAACSAASCRRPASPRASSTGAPSWPATTRGRWPLMMLGIIDAAVHDGRRARRGDHAGDDRAADPGLDGRARAHRAPACCCSASASAGCSTPATGRCTAPCSAWSRPTVSSYAVALFADRRGRGRGIRDRRNVADARRCAFRADGRAGAAAAAWRRCAARWSCAAHGVPAWLDLVGVGAVRHGGRRRSRCADRVAWRVADGCGRDTRRALVGLRDPARAAGCSSSSTAMPFVPAFLVRPRSTRWRRRGGAASSTSLPRRDRGQRPAWRRPWR